MSYEIAKSISVRKDKTTMTCRSSNVWPAHYATATFPTNHAELLREFDSGCIQPTDSANGYKWWWVLSELDKSGLQGEERLNRFISLLESKEPKGKYIVDTERGFVHKFTPTRWYRACIGALAKRYNYYHASYIASKLSNYKAKVIEA